jgi:hypothetical protein
MNYLAIGLGFVIVVLIYFLYIYFTNNTLTAGLTKLDTQVTTWPATKLTKPGSTDYSYQGWFYINNAPSNGYYMFYRKGTSNNGVGIGLALNGQTLAVYTNTSNANPSVAITSDTLLMTATTQFPIQKWVYVVLNVTAMKVIEVYLNGKLVQTVQVTPSALNNPSAQSDLVVGNQNLTNGYVTKFIRLPSTLPANTVWTNYLSGNGLNSMLAYILPYDINMAITKDNIVQQQYKIF